MRDVELERVLKEIEDHLFPRLHMTIRQRALYYHLFRHTRLVGWDSAVFALLPLANVLDISDSTAREDLRDLHAKGCIRIEERSRVGHVVRVLLPEEIDGIVVQAAPAEPVDVEALDFFTDRRFVDVLLVRESGRCFYCLRGIRKETCQLDHVTPQVAAGGNSYRNIVVACHECNTQKQGLDAADFVRTLYRRGIMSQAELEDRLGSIEKLKGGTLVPLV
jgi:5-methylcytosine-specific restriction endonuclease McrA